MHSASIIITTHNRPHLLRRAIKSALEAGEAVEVIVVDDASQDETVDVCGEFGDIKYVRLDRRQGVAGARNLGLLTSSAEYVSFLDDDDVRLPGSLDLQLELLKNTSGAGMICGTILVGDSDCRWTGDVIAPPNQNDGDLFWPIVRFEYSPLPMAVAVRKECFLKVGLFKKNLAGIDDWDMWARIAELFLVITSPEPIGIYRFPVHDSGQGSSDIAVHYRRAWIHQAQLLQLPRARAAQSATRREARAHARFQMSAHLLLQTANAQRSQSYSVAFETGLSALRINPFWFCKPDLFKGIGKRLLRTATPL